MNSCRNPLTRWRLSSGTPLASKTQTDMKSRLGGGTLAFCERGRGEGFCSRSFARAGKLLDANNQILCFLGRLDVVVGFQQIPQALVGLHRAANVSPGGARADQMPARDLMRRVEVEQRQRGRILVDGIVFRLEQTFQRERQAIMQQLTLGQQPYGECRIDTIQVRQTASRRYAVFRAGADARRRLQPRQEFLQRRRRSVRERATRSAC